MKPYIFKRRNLIHIIDLRATLRGLITAAKLARAVAARGDYILFVGTKKQAREIIEREARRCNMPYVAERWPGGLLTNYFTIRKRLDRLEELERLEQTGELQLYSKKMLSSLRREKRKIMRNLGGVRNMDRLPGLLVIVDPADEYIAVREAVKLGIPIIALTDTDGNPDDIDVVVPGNDDSIAAIEIFARAVADGILEAQSQRTAAPAPEAADQTEQQDSSAHAAEASDLAAAPQDEAAAVAGTGAAEEPANADAAEPRDQDAPA